MLNIVLACVSVSLLVLCIAVALSKERQKRRSEAAMERLTQHSIHFDEAALLRNRSERPEDW